MTTPKQDPRASGDSQCDGCGYTLADAILHGDHRLCGVDAPWEQALSDAAGAEFVKAYARATHGRRTTQRREQ